MKRCLLFVGIILVMLYSISVSQVEAAAPKLMNYQGTLADKDGEPLATKEYKISVKIFNKSEKKDSTLLWGPQTFDKVPVVDGKFNVILITKWF